MGPTSGTVKLMFQTFEVADRIRVYYQGALVADTQCVSTGSLKPAWVQTVPFNGTSSQLKVVVDPNCTGTSDTQWNYQLSCP